MPTRWPLWPRLLVYLPALVLALLSFVSGTFQAPLVPWAVAVGHLALCGLAALAGEGWRDPLGLGPRGWIPIGGLAVWIVASTLASPVPRAGRLVLVLAPVFLLVPAAVARCWQGSEGRRRGPRAVAWVVLAVASWALVDLLRSGDERAAMPLGQHNLLALWLVALLPLAVLHPGDGGFVGRGLRLAAGGLGVSALVATRSLAGVAGGLVALSWILWRWSREQGVAQRIRRLLLPAAVVLSGLCLAWPLPRVLDLVAGEDASFAARQGYWEAGWRGISEHPLLGWGPGSTPWTVARFLAPRPGVHPSHDVVADLHDLPLQLAWELGLPGAILTLGLFLAVLAWGWAAPTDRGGLASTRLATAGEAGWLGAMVAGLGGLPLAVHALPLALALLLGTLRAGREPEAEASSSGARSYRPSWWVPLAALFFLLPVDLAQGLYDRAVLRATGGDEMSADAEGGSPAAELRRASALDPGFPLYRARLAWLEADAAEPLGLGWSARRARRAAEDAHSVAALWLKAGVLAQEADEPWARTALLEACRLDPLGAMAPYRLALYGDREPLAELWAAHALVAEPRLLAAEDFRRRPALLRVASDRVRLTEGIDRGWRARFAEAAEAALDYGRLHAGGQKARLQRLVLTLDQEAAQSPSLYTFRRRPWPTRLISVALHADLVETLDLPPATRLDTTDTGVFRAPLCALGAVGER